MDNNVYLLTDRATGEQLLVDAADDAPRVLALVAEGVPNGGHGLATVVTTHQHWDHHRALTRCWRRQGRRGAAGRDDATHLPVSPDVVLDHGDTVTVGRPRSTSSICAATRPDRWRWCCAPGDGGTHVFTGDSLFPGGVGNTQQDPRGSAS